MATKADIDQWIAAQGGPGAVSYGYEDVEVDNPAFNNPDHPNYQGRTSTSDKTQARRETWTNKATGATFSAVRTPYGSDQFQDIKETPGTKSTTGPPRTPEQQQTDTATASNATALENERAYHSAMGHGHITHAEYQKQLDDKATAARNELAAARASGQQDRITKAQEDQNQLAHDRLAFDKDKENAPDVKTVDVPVNGVHYTRTTVTRKDGTTAIKQYGPDGKEIPAIPGEGAATASDQRMPDWVHLGASEGLRQGWDMLQKDPTKTPEIRKSIFQEMVQAANIFQNQANTEERERESNRNASSNEAKYKLDFMQTGMQQALSFAQEVIKGGSGSAAGGKMFGVLMGMQLLQMKMSGINDLAPGQKPKPLPVVTPADLRDPAKLDAKAAEVQTHLETAQATTDTTHQTIDNLLNRPATPAAPAAPAAPVSQGPAVATPAPAGLTTPQLGQGQDLSAPAGNPIGAPSSELGQPGDPGYGSTYRTPGDAASPPPGYPEPGMVSLPQPDSAPMMQPGPHPYAQPEPSQYSGGSDVQMAPPTSDWSALANVMPQQPAAQPQTAPDNGQPPTAMLAAKIKSTPPWRLDTSEIQQALAMGIPMEEIMSIPGRVA